jgi:hypothetical protein
MERKYFIENIAPLLNANAENSIGVLQRIRLLKRTFLCMHCNCSMLWCVYNKIKDKYTWKWMTKTWQYKTTCSTRSGSKFEDCTEDLNLVIFDTYSWTVGTQEVGLSTYRTF